VGTLSFTTVLGMVGCIVAKFAFRSLIIVESDRDSFLLSFEAALAPAFGLGLGLGLRVKGVGCRV